MMPMILTVYLSSSEQAVTEVPITPETRCRDVVDFCKEPGESGCHLAEVWRGNERAIPFDHMMYDHLQKWGPRKQEVKFFLRHEESPTESSSDQGSQQPQDQARRKNGGSVEKPCENGVGSPRVELTLLELQEMASRQQQQIEAQQQMLVAKEQRLRYLKQQERRQQQTETESEKLQRLKERVESQEAKLKKIRAMRGQADYSKVTNGNLSAEMEHINGVFQEKQQELQVAVLKVDQLTQQLDDLRRGKLTLGGQVTGTAALELRKLYQELQIRNKLNQDQNSKLQQHKELLNRRNTEVTLMDRRIAELRERLHKKKAELNRINGPPSPQPAAGGSGRVAAVGPYIQVPVPTRQDMPPEPLKPQSLSVPPPIGHAHSKTETEGRGLRKPPTTWKVSDLDIVVDPLLPSSPGAPSGSDGVSCEPAANESDWPVLSNGPPPLKPPDRKETNADGPGKTGPPVPTATPPDKGPDSAGPRPVGPTPPSQKPPPPPYGTYPCTGAPPPPPGSGSPLERRRDSLPRPGPASANPAWQRAPPPTGSSSQQIQQRITVPPSPTFQPPSPLFPPAGERQDPLLAAAVRPFVPDKGSRPQSPRKGPPTVNSSSIYHMYLQQAAHKAHPLNSKLALKAVYGKPVLPSASSTPSPLPFLQGAPGAGVPGGGEEGAERGGEGDVEGQAPGPGEAPPPHPGVENIPRPLSPTKLTPVAHSPLRYQSDADLEALRRKLANAPRPLKKRSSITEPEGPGGPNIQKLLYQRFNTLAGGMEGAGGTPFYQPANPPEYPGPPAAAAAAPTDVENGNAANGNPPDFPPPPAAEPAAPPPPAARLLPPVLGQQRQPGPAPPPPPEQTSGPSLLPRDSVEDSNNNPALAAASDALPSPIPEEEGTPPLATPSSQHLKRSNLKKPDSERTGHGLRVKFNPLALLLDASLEGEFDLVQRIIYEVDNPSMPNDEGITPLHNSVCAGHHHIVKFLLDFGVNVNAADSDGWTPLHCAASCNSVHLCKLLVESGAAIFGTTISDVETAADKCEEMEEGYVQCSQFLRGVQEKMGVMNKGAVYALWDYEAQGADELSFQEGDAVTVLSRKDDSETDWWWARLSDKEGYVPRNLLGLYPRIKPRQRSLA
ncbi:apoptosis-stimulating of p53 protein 1-like isoform X1 [Anguilla rostrata]|uniref:apoptosis-stimulating of p53 protein 1-like isoform X1 n=1 Tax=Anguilla rostrata TaxID=7938 RepID=UPI0030D48D56